MNLFSRGSSTGQANDDVAQGGLLLEDVADRLQ
jgi:hypothetical protein